jgi:hypothetical protein
LWALWWDFLILFVFVFEYVNTLFLGERLPTLAGKNNRPREQRKVSLLVPVLFKTNEL